jgi:hypothetical protein
MASLNVTLPLTALPDAPADPHWPKGRQPAWHTRQAVLPKTHQQAYPDVACSSLAMANGTTNKQWLIHMTKTSSKRSGSRNVL